LYNDEIVVACVSVEEVLSRGSPVVPSVKAMTDLQALAGALLDSLNDKSLALSHQRKTNKYATLAVYMF